MQIQTLIMGNRDDIDEMSSGNASILTTVLKLIDKYDLYGQVAYPKHHKQSDVPDIYRLAAKTRVCMISLLEVHVYVTRVMAGWNISNGHDLFDFAFDLE